ncbi:MAG: DUF885 domain-containing protein [bacterium]
MRKLLSALFVIIGILSLIGCSGRGNADLQFEKLAGDYITGYLEMYPERATSLGDHRYDAKLNDRSLAGIQQAIDFNRKFAGLMQSIDPQKLSMVNRIDYGILQQRIDRSLFNLEELREFTWNPRVYNIGGAIYNLLVRDFAPLEERLFSVKQRLLAVPEVIAAAQANLDNPPQIFTETAITQNRGTMSLIENDLDEFVQQVPGIKPEIDAAREVALHSLNEYQTWLEEELLPNSNGDFRLGEERFRKKLHFTLESDISMEEVLSRAQEKMIKTQAELYQTALEIHRRNNPAAKASDDKVEQKKLIQQVLDRLADSHPNNETIVAFIEQTLQETRQFTIENDLVTVPDDPINIIVMPEFQRGVAMAYCDSPGPLEQERQTFYAVSPAPADWTAERVISTFREDNNYMLHELTIHEAMPGHYLQLAHANRFQAPTMVRAIFSSGPFIEGWATYAEQVMMDHGYGGPEVKMQQLKMHLRVCVNAIIDQKIHTAGMTEEEAMKMMIEEGFQEEGEAAGKWRRACLTTTQLSTYFVGNLEMNAIRNDYETKLGDGFNLKQFHDQVLSYGSPPLKYVREMMGI